VRQALECLFSLAFLVDYIFSTVFALDSWAYVVSFNGVVDLLSVLPAVSFAVLHYTPHVEGAGIDWIDLFHLIRCVLV
jgi:hypothetical protein